MKKRLMILVLGLVLAMTVMPAGAAKYKDLTGTWVGSWTGVFTQNKVNFFQFNRPEVTMNIAGQDDLGNFYGFLNTGSGDNPLTGSISTNKEVTLELLGSGDNPATYSFKGKWTGKGIQGVLSLSDTVFPALYIGKLNIVFQP